MTRTPHAARIGASLLTLVVATACSEAPVMPASPASGVAGRMVAHPSRYATPSADRHIMELNQGIPDDLAAQVGAKGGTVVFSHAASGLVVTSGLSDADAEAIGGKANTVRDVEATWIPTADEMGLEILDASGADLGDPEAAATPKSPLTAFFYLNGRQWNPRNVWADRAWAQGRSGIPSVRVAILDTGLDPSHQDMNGTVIDWASSFAFTPSIAPDAPTRWTDDQFHGTHVGGIVTTNNIGAAGIAPNVSLVAVKVLRVSGSGSFADILAAIYYSADVGVEVINMSLGAYLQRQGVAAAQLLRLMNNAINYAHAREVLVVSAAGNNNSDLQHDQNYMFLPCEAGVQLCVSSTTLLDTKSSFSNYGTNSIDVAAPGGGAPLSVLSLCNSYSMTIPICRTHRGWYTGANGTSMAAPHVAALGAFLDSQYGGTLNASQLITAIEQHADDLGKPGADPIYGKGRINVFRTLNEYK